MAGLKKILSKHNIDIKEYDIFIETGLYDGETFISMFNEGMFSSLEKAYSIELAEQFINSAYAKCPALRNSNSEILHGDSGLMLKEVLEKNKDKRILMWLDSHYSGGPTAISQEFGECPIEAEIDSISILGKKPTIIIDDLGAFQNGTPYYLPGWPYLDSLIEKAKNHFDFEVFISERDEPNMLHYSIFY